ncbi:MAG: hypothetical protein JWR11_365 [Mycobacterium sp.]|jgi:hypothetical protein|nr:hypothetical protein [Mycobacterium sp.]MDT5176135.1 hypothetical protein [Mycobacterium sp.]
MRNLETIDTELRNLAAVHRMLLEYKSSASTTAQIVGQVDELLDERNLVSH